MMNLDENRPAPECFSCGKKLPEDDYNKFHLLKKKYIAIGKSENYANNVILDGELSQPYIRKCCRLMFLGDPIEYRNCLKYYDFSKKNEHVDISNIL